MIDKHRARGTILYTYRGIALRSGDVLQYRYSDGGWGYMLEIRSPVEAGMAIGAIRYHPTPDFRVIRPSEGNAVILDQDLA
jgi:hypothetical protein